MGGKAIGPTDVTHPLLTYVYCAVNLLRLFKDGVHRSKTDLILIQTHMHVTLPYQNYHACLSE